VLPILAVIVPAAAFIRAGYSWSSATARKTVLLGVFVVLAFVSYVVLPGDWMHEYRFATIAFPTTYLLTFLILQQILAANQRIHSPSAILACAGVAALVAVAPGFAVRSQVFAAHPAAPLESVAQSSYRYDALADGLKLDHPSILLPDLGGALLLSRMRVVDLAGLCDRQFGRMRFEHREPEVLAEHILRNVKPDLVHIRGYWAIRSGLLKSEEFARTYLSLGDGDFVRRTSLPREMGDDAALSIKEGVKRLVRVDIHLRLNTALRLGR